MGMMARMRSLAPWFILLVGGIFVLFMVLSDSSVLEFVGAQRNIVGSIDGEDITYQDYNNMVERARANQRNQTGKDIDESQMDMFRDQVWQSMVMRRLMEEKMDKLGITVSDDEVRDAILGPNPPQFLTQQFIDSTGKFNRQAYEGALNNPQNKQLVIQVENEMREQLKTQKLQDYVTASITVSEDELLRKYKEQNIRMNAAYVEISANTIPDSSISVTDDDAKKYYNENLDKYKVDAQRKLKYVLFRRMATAADSQGVKNNLEAIVAKLKTDTSSFKTYVNIYSEQPYSEDTLSLSVIPEQARSLIQSAKPGDIVGPVLTYQGYVVYRVVNAVKGKKEEVRASHILIRNNVNDAAAKAKADEIYNKLVKGADFAQMAKENSEDPGSAVKGGDLGWFGKGQMVKEFENAAFNGKVGVVQKPIKTNYGYHIIKVTGRSDEAYVLEQIVNKITPSGTTLDKIYNDANDFAYLAGENDFEQEANLDKYNVIETPAFKEDAQAIPGLGACPPLVTFAFENGVGDVSQVFKVPSGYVVAKISDVIKPGVKPFADVEAFVKNAVKLEKKLDKAYSIMTQIKQRIGQNGDFSVAKEVYPLAKVDTTGEFTANQSIKGIGRDYTFAAYCSEAKKNVISEPIKSTRAVYIIKLVYRTEFLPETFAAERRAWVNNVLNQKKSAYFTQWIDAVKKDADIVDKRYLFYK